MPTENPGQGATWTGAGIGEQQHVLDIAPSPAAQGWRQRFISLGIGIHELAERFPDPSDEELAELGRDVVENGLRHPIVFYCDRTKRNRKDYPHQHELILIDGRSRLTAMERAGISLFDERGYFNPDVECDDHRDRDRDPVEIRWRDFGDDNTGFDPVAYIISVNVRRRHLTAEKKRELVAELLKAKPERSDRETARIAGSNRTTVGQVRRELEEKGGVSIIDTRTDAAGRQQPARKLSEHAREITREKLEQIRAEAPKETDAPVTIDQLGDRKDVLRVLDEAIRLLLQRSAEVLALPRHVRSARAMRALNALGFSVSDLVPPGRR